MISQQWVRRAGLALALLSSAASCSSASNSTAVSTAVSVGSHAGHDNAVVAGAPDVPVAGAQGRVPQFLVECPFSHALADDPIVYPGVAGASHVHVFFGNDGANAGSTYDSLLAGTSACDQPEDTASYWVPALMQGDTMLTPTKSVAYYRPGEGIDPVSVQPYPPGLEIIAGDGSAEAEQSTAVVAWTCGAGITRMASPPSCPISRPLRLMITFPDCWDGEHVDSDDHRSHMAYSSRGSCPAAHPVAVPQLQLAVVYSFSGDPSGLSLSSGSILTGHADFFNAWVQDKLAGEIDACIHRKVVCGVTSGRK
ncbi:unannotated protein [freshwater metagenome]|uniref:Unannotated protein n=1 Tax=freshwater metagenome TaxID=449393 RepID=A0A6J7DWG9_9ZZZZ